MGKYDYLKPYVHSSIEGHSWFMPVSDKEILEAEEKLTLSFPKQLKHFWQEIGYGALHTGLKNIRCAHDNYIMSPNDVASIMLKEEGAPIVPYILDDWDYYFDEGEIPFFEIGDSSSFLVMKPNSEYPNGVYDMSGDLIEKDLETFIYNLYYWAPDYYIELDEDANRINAVENREKNKS